MLRVTVVYSPAARQVHEWPLALDPGATVLDALLASGLPTAFPALDLQRVDAGVWGRHRALTQPLSEGDRIELYRPLAVDPKVARRERFRKQGTRAAGLFAEKKAGAKAGY